MIVALLLWLGSAVREYRNGMHCRHTRFPSRETNLKLLKKKTQPFSSKPARSIRPVTCCHGFSSDAQNCMEEPETSKAVIVVQSGLCL
jgi:hypothetical protein